MIKTIIATSIMLFAGLGPYAQSKTAKGDIKFLEDITVDLGNQAPQKQTLPTKSDVQIVSKSEYTAFTSSIESASKLQLKYALLLNTEVEYLQVNDLYKNIDYWYGTPYRMGGETKTGVDCSALVQFLYTSHYGIKLPRTAREQYTITKRISRTELKEGDLVFFNTAGGVSHVGIYLQNNKFVHASSSDGVTISDIYDPYWSRRFIGVGRYEGINERPALSFSK